MSPPLSPSYLFLLGPSSCPRHQISRVAEESASRLRTLVTALSTRETRSVAPGDQRPLPGHLLCAPRPPAGAFGRKYSWGCRFNSIAEAMMVHGHLFVCDTASPGQADWFRGINQKRSRLLCGHRPLQHKGISFRKLAFLICTTPSFVAWQEIKLSGRVLRGQPVELGPARAGGHPRARRLPPPARAGTRGREPPGGRSALAPSRFLTRSRGSSFSC